MSAVFLTAGGVFRPVEDALTAQRAEFLSRQASGNTAIVEIDARSLAVLRSWPWPRRYHAEVVRRLHGSGAAIIAFDVDFSARSESGDEELASAIREAGHVILPTFEQRASAQRSDILASRPDSAFEEAWIGGVNIFPDSDGVVREYPAATRIGGNIQPSIATLVAENDSLGDRSFQPDWAIEPGSIPRFSFVDVMKGRVPAEKLQGKRILIGATAIELGDRYAVPRYGVVPGVVIQALAAESLLQDRAVQRTGLAVTILGILAIALLLAPRPLQHPLRYAATSGLLLMAIVAGPVLAQFAWPVSVDSAAWLFAWMLAIAVQAGVEARRRLRVRAMFDAESGLPNRSVLERALGEVDDSPVLVAAAIERFEFIRDSIGLAATNETIRSAADKIGEIVAGAVYRVGPDILAWTQPDTDEAVQATLRRIQAAFREPVQSKGGPVDVTFTLGLERESGSSAAVLRIERALAAISNARAEGRALAWHREADPQMRRQLSMMSDLRHAMEKGRLQLFYQPKMSLQTGRIADAEALIRWRDADGKFVSPDEFIPLAEATGVIREITQFALRAAMADLQHWAREGVALRVAVNISALDLGTSDFVESISRNLRESNVPVSQLTLEVTESALIRSPAEAISTLTALREKGIRLAVDDYGTGQST
ncbi:MAG TPA: EAL domain-containing protein, partial [Sphingomicrobium sp.]|nr:EAL domain-containing protein [Sphingomicrobium sp.]